MLEDIPSGKVRGQMEEMSLVAGILWTAIIPCSDEWDSKQYICMSWTVRQNHSHTPCTHLWANPKQRRSMWEHFCVPVSSKHWPCTVSVQVDKLLCDHMSWVYTDTYIHTYWHIHRHNMQRIHANGKYCSPACYSLYPWKTAWLYSFAQPIYKCLQMNANKTHTVRWLQQRLHDTRFATDQLPQRTP